MSHVVVDAFNLLNADLFRVYYIVCDHQRLQSHAPLSCILSPGMTLCLPATHFLRI